jgi:phosphate-selective porin OprO and OprP
MHQRNHALVAIAARFAARLAITIIAALCMSLASTASYAVTAEQLLELLFKKGVITEEEYRILSKDKRGEEPQPAEPKAGAKEEPKAAAKEERARPAENEVRGVFRDGITFESADKQNSIAIRGRVEADYRQFGGADAANADTFDVRRAYLSAEGKFWENYEFRLRGNFSSLSGPTTQVCTAVGTTGNPPVPTCTQTAQVANTSTSHLDEAWLNINWWPQAQFKFGQYKMPFSLEQMTTDLYLDFTERSMGDALVPGKERGYQVHGVPLTGIYYALALSNGQGINANETNNAVDNTDIIGRATLNFAELFGRKEAVYHIGASYSTGTIPPAAAVSARTEGRGIAFFTPGAFTGVDVERTRYGLETGIAYGPVKFQAEHINAGFKGRSALNVDFDKDIKSYYGNLTWLVTGEHYAQSYRAGVFNRVRPKSNFSPKGGGLGAWELGLRYSRFDASAFGDSSAALVGSGVKPSTSANVAKAWTIGVKWIMNPNTRFTLNYIKTKFDTPVTVANSGNTATVDDEQAVNLRAQFDF